MIKQKQKWVSLALSVLSHGGTLASIAAQQGISRQAVQQRLLLCGVEGIREQLSIAMAKGAKHRKKRRIVSRPKPVLHSCQVCEETFYKVLKKGREYKTCSRECRYTMILKGLHKGIAIYDKPTPEEARALRMTGKTWRSIVEDHGYFSTSAIMALIQKVAKYERKNLPQDQWVIQPRRKQ